VFQLDSMVHLLVYWLGVVWYFDIAVRCRII